MEWVRESVLHRISQQGKGGTARRHDPLTHLVTQWLTMAMAELV